MRGVNIHDKPPRPALWRYILCTPIGFMVSASLLAWVIALVAHGNPPLSRMFFVASTVVVMITVVLVVKAAAASPPGFWQCYSGWAQDMYAWDLYLGRNGPVGMQALTVISTVLIGLCIWLETGLPASDRLIGPALGVEITQVDDE
ncbi:MAG: hypothetical protein ED559_01935 [Phycisphaera sp.]|nr:MAG: hypothetical protein ED559_01935 [Phycisphaera sp.]